MALYFHASPQEQLQWLEPILDEDDIWCWVRRRENSFLASDSSSLKRIRFEPRLVTDLRLGRHSVSEPVWVSTGYGPDIDVLKSQIIQFTPSLIFEGRILTEGQLAISPAPYYGDVGIDFSSVNRWYQQLRRSFMKLIDRQWMVVVHWETETREYREVWLTPGAVKWYQEGKQLKEEYQFFWRRDLAPRTPRKKEGI